MAIKLANGFSEHKLRIMFPSSKHLQLRHRVFIYKIMIRKTWNLKTLTMLKTCYIFLREKYKCTHENEMQVKVKYPGFQTPYSHKR